MIGLSMFINIFVALLISTQSVFSLKCYICSSAQDKECGKSPPPAKFLHECSLENYKNLIAKPFDVSNVTESVSHETSTVTSTNRPSETTSELPLNRTSRSVDTQSIPDNFTLQPNEPKSDSEFTFCRKNVYTIPAQHNGPSLFNKLVPKKASVRVLRSCGWISEDDKKGEKSPQSTCTTSRGLNTGRGSGGHGAKVVVTEKCVCTGNKCNSGNYLEALSLAPHMIISLTILTTQYIL